MGVAAQGALAKLATKAGAAPHDFASGADGFEFVAETLIKQGQILDTNGIRGTRSHVSERTRSGTYTVTGAITLHPSPADLDIWLPRILGAAENSDVFALAETLPSFGVLLDRVTQRFQYTDLQVNSAVFRSSAGGLLELTLNLIGKAEITGTAFPSLTLGVAANNAPYVHEDAVFTLGGSAREVIEWELTIDNALGVRMVNSVTATDLTPQDRNITCRIVTPYSSSETALYGQAAAGIAGTVQYANGGLSTLFAFGVLQTPDRSPNVPGKSEITLTMEMVARMSGATRELVVTNDSVA